MRLTPGYVFLFILLLSGCTRFPDQGTEVVPKTTFPATLIPMPSPTSTEDLALLELNETQPETFTPTPSDTPTLTPTILPTFMGGSQWLVSIPDVQFTYLNTMRDGGYLLLGRVDWYSSPKDILFRLNAQGEIIWQRNFNDPIFHGVLEAGDGGVVLTGMWGLNKLNSDGAFQWYENLNYSDDSQVASYYSELQSSHSGSAGQTIALEDGTINVLDREGALLSQKFLGSEYREGRSTSWLTTEAHWSAGMEINSGFWVIRDSPNEPTWIRLFDFSNFDITILVPPEEILGTRDGGAVLVAPVRHLIRPAFAIWAVRMDRNGNILWQTAIDGVDEYDIKVHETPDGGFIITSNSGYWGDNGSVNYLRILHINTYGNLVWDRFYGDGEWQAVPGAIVDSADGGFLIAGDIESGGSEMGGNAGDLFLLKIDRNGKVPECPWLHSTPYGPPRRKSPLTSYNTRTATAFRQATIITEQFQSIQIEMSESDYALSSYCVYPQPPAPPTPTSLPTPAPIPADPTGLYPIAMADGTLLGAVSGDDWIHPNDNLPATEDLRFHLFSLSGYRGEIQGSLTPRTEGGECPGSRTITFSSTPEDPSAIALGGAWSAQPWRTSLVSPSLVIYQDLVHDWLQSSGIDDPQVHTSSIYRADLEGDGIDEVLINASWYEEGLATSGASAGDYTVVLLRKFVDGEVQTLALIDHVYPTDDAQAVPQAYEVVGILDLNGDGAMEIVLRGSSSLGYKYLVFEPTRSVDEPVLEVDCAAQ